VDFLLYLQKISNPILDNLFIWITNLGSENFYVIITTYIFWCINKELGIKLFTLTTLSFQLNAGLKELFHTERPIYYKGINPIYVESAPGYSFPSGHTQVTTTFWYYLIKEVKNKSLTLIGSTIILLVGFSRLYLRVHWPIDVLGGLIIGFIIVLVYFYAVNSIKSLFINYLVSIGFSIVFPVLLLLIFPDEIAVKLTALLSGALIGYFTEIKFINFRERNILTKQIIKYIIGLSIFMILKTILKMMLPDEIMFNYLRYFILGIWTTLIAPWLFVKLRLA
jgi:membrane-associated phospholipid phosphatase